MAISLKQLYLLNEYWTTTDFTHPETGEKDTAQHWEPSSGKKMYSAPNIDVTKKSSSDSKVREKSTQIFYDFYAMELLHALLGSSKKIPTSSKMKALLPLAATTGVNPALIGIDWENVEFPLGNMVLPEKLRSQIDTMYEEVTIALSNKLQEHLRRSLVQELRHLINHSSQWQRFRNDILTHYNSKGTLSKEDFISLVKKRLPNMSNHLDAVSRLLLFSRHYSRMGSDDPADIVAKADPKPSGEKDDPSKYYDIEKDPKAIDISKKKEDEPEEEPEEEIPDYPDWEPESGEFDPTDPFSKKIKKQWKDKLKEDYASGKISPSTIRTINKAINKAGLKWEDIVLAYNNIEWNSGYGGEKWGEGVVSYLKLVQASKNQDIDKMAAAIDHIYDLSHNNGPLLNKGGMYVSAEDLDRRSKVTHIARFLPDVSPIVRQLILNVMRHLPGTNVEVEKNIDTFLNAPTVPFSEEQKKNLIQYNLNPYIGEVFIGKAPFTNKQGTFVDRTFLVKAHTNGKFTIGDSMRADSKVFDTFEQLDQYLKDVISKETEPTVGGSSTIPPPQTLAGVIHNFITGHIRVKLPSDKAQKLFDQCKMGWREKSQYYKAYFPGAKRAMFYAFSDGTYLVITNEYNNFEPTTDWDVALGYATELTQNAIPYPEPEKAKAHIAAGISMEPPPPTPQTPPPTPLPPTQPATPQTSVTPTAYPSVANQLPPPSPTPAAYSVHSGLTSAPTKTIRLTEQDEGVIANIGFSPKLINGLVWYIHKGTGDTVKFYPNNTAKLSFASSGKFSGKLPSGGSKPPVVITFAIFKMLQWLQQNYTTDTTISPILAPTSKPSAPEKTPSTPATTGINPGSLFNPQIQAAGFKWDQSSGTYSDGQNSLMIKPNRSSLLYFGNGQQKHFKNLPELIAYLSDEYPDQKKTFSINDPVTPSPEPPSDSGEESPNPNYHALVNELIAEVASAINMSPETVANIRTFKNTTHTIPVIKAIRTFYKDNNMEYGLGSAKSASEHWQDFLAYIRDNGLPLMPASGSFEFNKNVVGYNSKKKSPSYNTPMLTYDEKEWIMKYFASTYPYLEVDLAPDGSVYINQPSADVISEITKGYKPLFIIYKSSSSKYVIKTLWSQSGEQAFNTFGELTHFISTSLDTLIPPAPAPKSPQQKGWEQTLQHNYKGTNLDGTSTGANLVYNDFDWSEKNGAYVNNVLHQIVVVNPQIGFNSFHIYWTDKNGILNTTKVNSTSDLYSAIGHRGSIAKNEKNKFHLPTSEQEELLKKLGFVKNTPETSLHNVITYTKPSSDSGNAYFAVNINPYTGKVDYTEVGEDGAEVGGEGTSEGYSYGTLGHALTFLKNKFANDLNDDDDDDDDDDVGNVDYISDELIGIGFVFKRTDGMIYEYFNKAGNEYVGVNIETGNLTYGTLKSEGVIDIEKSFYNVDDFVSFYKNMIIIKNYIISNNEKFKDFQKLGFSITSDSNTTTVFKKISQDVIEHVILYYKTTGNVSYHVADSDDLTISSKTFYNIADAIDFLNYKFEFNPPAEVPYSGADYKISFSGVSPYQPMRLNTFDETTLNDMGFNYYKELFIGTNKMGDPIYIPGYRTSDGRRLTVYGDGDAIYQTNDNDPGMKFKTIKEALQYLWQGIDWNRASDLTKNKIKWKLSAKPEPPAKSGDMPYSGYDYSLVPTLFNVAPTKSIFLTETDEDTLRKIGFNRSEDVSTTNIAYQKFYTNGNDRVYFFASGKAAYWKGADGPYYYDTVKDVMRFLWNKHTTYIEEVANYKSFMKNWLE
jgi:hypothetical protein